MAVDEGFWTQCTEPVFSSAVFSQLLLLTERSPTLEAPTFAIVSHTNAVMCMFMLWQKLTYSVSTVAHKLGFCPGLGNW